ncbi:MAG TPA: hypothetical protein VH854_14950 [Thermoanaerobaculia bacterium]|nr:hypothetical protein [Thermoanaerobaculia bacterium]
MKLPRALVMRGLVAALLLSGAAAAQAQFPGNVPNTFRLNAGGMYAWMNTAVTFEQNGGGGNGISFEDTLDLPSSRAGFYGRGSLNFSFLSFDFGYLGFSRSRGTTLSQDIVFGDTTYTAGASVEAKQKSQLPYADIRFNFLHNPSTQLGLTLGVAYPILQAELSAAAGVVGPGGPIVGQTVTSEAEIKTPVPLLGIVFDAALSDQVSAGIVFNGIFAPVHPYVGSIFQADAHVDWYFANNFGVGGAFNYTRFRIKRDDLPTTLVDFRHDFYGPRAYLILTF